MYFLWQGSHCYGKYRTIDLAHLAANDRGFLSYEIFSGVGELVWSGRSY